MDQASYPSLRGRITFVTGGGSGIGEELVRSFTRQGSQVAFVDIAEEASRQLCAELAEETGREPWFLPCDVRDVPALQAAVAQVGRDLGDISVLLNNAGNDQRHALEDVTPEYWDDRMAVNQRHLFFAAQAVVPQMTRRGGGSIVNWGSTSWRLAMGGMPAYTMAKAGIHGLTRGLARDLGPLGIRVNTLLPGWVMTGRQLAHWVTPEVEAELQARQCLKERLLPGHIASMALFLASDDSAMVTAEELTVDAGWI